MAARPPDMNDWYTRQGLTVKGGGITLQAGGAIKGGQTAYATGTGFFMGYSGSAYKFSIGNSTNNLTWDGTTLTVAGNISIGTTNSIMGGKTGYATGTGFFLGYSGGAYKFDIGSATAYLRWTGAALTLVGDISGASSIDITGTAKFGGNFVSGLGGGLTTSLESNASQASNYGIVGWGGSGAGNKVGVYGRENSAVGGTGVIGYSVNGYGVEGTGVTGVWGVTLSAGGFGVHAQDFGGSGTALKVSGTTTASGVITSTVATGTAPFVVASTTKVTNLNADLLDGNDSSAFATAGHNHTGVYQAAGNYVVDGTATSYTLYGTQTPGTGVATYDGSAKPGGSTTNVWIKVIINGTTYYIPVWT